MQLLNLFYRNVLSEKKISGFFDDIDMDEEIAKQKAFLTMAFADRRTIAAKTCAKLTGVWLTRRA